MVFLGLASHAGAQTAAVGNFVKSTNGTGNQVVPHQLGRTPAALFFWTEGRTDETFSDSTDVVYRASASAGVASGNLTISKPTGTLMNDVMIAAIGVSGTNPTITAPAGWTLVRRLTNTAGTDNSLAIFRKTAGASEATTYTWTIGTNTGATGGIMSFSGVDLEDSIDVENGQTTASGTTHQAPSVTTTAGNETIVTVHTFSSARTWLPPTGMTEVVDVQSQGASANGQSLEMNYVAQAGIAATGTKTATSNTSADTGNTETIALRPKHGNHASVGMTDGTTSGSISTSTRNGVTTADATRRAANKALTIVKWDGIVMAESDFVSWDANNFTLNWTTNDTEPYVIHFIAIGGNDVVAKVVNWQMATATGNQSITGVGFKPMGVIHIHANSGLTGTAPSNDANGGMGFGVMDSAGNQWATSTFSTSTNPSDSQRGQQTDATIYTFTNALGVAKEAKFVSMDSDGFTLNYSTANANAGQVFSLVLGGLNFKAGNFTKPTTAAPAAQTITGVGFLPHAVFLHSFQDIARATPVAEARLGYGASDGSSGNSSAFAEQDNVSPTNTQGIDKVTKHFMKVNNSTGTIDAEADLTNLNNDGFALNWTKNDAVATQMLYFALAPLAPTEVRLLSFDATRYDRGTLLQWRTGYEVDNLGFNLYREVNGVRTRVNPSLIGGSGLLAGHGTVVSGEQTYARWDLASSDPLAVYWLEDIDFNGTRTLHGPLSPTPAAVNALPPTVVASHDLSDLRQSKKGPIFVHRREGGLDTFFDRVRPGLVSADAGTTQWNLAAGAAVKIGVNRSGWYRVTQPELVAAGLDRSVDPRRLHLFVDGVEVAMRVTGEESRQFSAGDAIEFYGTAADTAFTDTRIYWLATDSRQGLRTTLRRQPVGGPGGPSGPASFLSTVERKDRTVFFAALENGDKENWFGPLVTSDPTVLTLDADHLDPAVRDAAQLEVSLQGVTGGTSHQVSVVVNGSEIGQLRFRGQALDTETFAVPAAVLREGSNDVTLIARDGDADVSLVDVLRLSYRHTYRADADILRFTVDASGPVVVGGFVSPSIRVVDITDPSAVIELTGQVARDRDGSYAVTARADGSGPRTLLAFSNQTIYRAASVEQNHPSAWHLAAQAHDYVIVSHSSLIDHDHLKPLVDLRTREGHSPAVIDVEDLYDEFSYGQKTPQAIRDFFAQAARTWKTAPKFVVLAGDATVDPRDYAGLGDADLVPTKQVPMVGVSLETASDDWFVDLDGTGLPKIAIGRLSVRTPEQADAVVAKIVGYRPDNPQDWTKSVLLVADQNDETSNFEGTANTLKTFVPQGYAVQRLLRGGLSADAARDALTSAVNQGQLIVDFSGHGSVQLWGKDGELLTNQDVVDRWRNDGRLPFVVAMNCLNGLFDQIWEEESLAESLQRAPSSGAVAVWASSSVTSSATQSLVNAEVFRLIFSNAYPTLGEAVTAAKRVVGSPDLRRSWIFFGDPAMRLAGVQPARSTETAAFPAPVVYATAATQQPTPEELQALAARPSPIRLQDFNGDGRADVLGYDSETGRSAMAFGAGILRAQWPAGWQVVAGDLNGDGKSDLIFFKPATSEWGQGITRSAGVFAFTQGRWRDDVGADAQLVVGDFDGDGRDDLLTYSPGDGSWTLGLSDGRGAFTFRRGTLPSALRVQAADVNGDGVLDLFGYAAATGQGVVALGGQDGRFSVTTRAWGSAWRVTVGHFGGSAGADLLFYDARTGAWQEALNDGQGRFTLYRGTWAAGLELHAADLDGDRRDDLFGYNTASGMWMTAMPGATGGFAVDSGSWAPGYAIATGDLSGDGRDEIFVLEPVSGAAFQCVRMSRGVFAFVPRSFAPGSPLVGRPR